MTKTEQYNAISSTTIDISYSDLSVGAVTNTITIPLGLGSNDTLPVDISFIDLTMEVSDPFKWASGQGPSDLRFKVQNNTTSAPGNTEFLTSQITNDSLKLLSSRDLFTYPYINAYEESTFELSVDSLGIAAWAMDDDMPQAKRRHCTFGTLPSGFALAGIVTTPPDYSRYLFEYVSGTWFPAVDHITTITAGIAGAGGNTTALVAGGKQYSGGVTSITTDAFTFDGTAFSSAAAISPARWMSSMVGTSSAALLVGGSGDVSGSTLTTLNVHSFNGSWTTEQMLLVPTLASGMSGTASDCFLIGGKDSQGSTFAFNGTSWSTSYDLPVDMWAHGACGDTTDALAFGGTNLSGRTLIFDTDTWSVTSSLNVDRQYTSGFGTTSEALCCGGYSNVGATGLTSSEYYSVSAASTPQLNQLTQGTLSITFKYIDYSS